MENKINELEYRNEQLRQGLNNYLRKNKDKEKILRIVEDLINNEIEQEGLSNK